MVEVSIKRLVVPGQPRSTTKFALGELFTSTVCFVESIQPQEEETISFTSYVPGSAKICTGFFSVEVVPSSPKFQSQLLILPSSTVERSSNGVGEPLQTKAWSK